MWSEPDVTRYIGGRPFSQEEVWARLLRYVGHWNWLGFGYWVIEQKSDNSFIGELGFADLKRDMLPSLDGLPELGWVLKSNAHGKGFATEAVHAALAWGDLHFKAARTVCLIHPENVASLRVAHKAGYHEMQHTNYKGNPVILFNR